MSDIACMGCGARFAAADGPVHPYMTSTPGCWSAFGRVLAREYQEPRLRPVHRLSVDAYAVQHPGTPCRQASQSVGVHLVRLCLFLERGLDPVGANDAMLRAARHKASYHWLEPPAARGGLTVADIDAAADAEAHLAAVAIWARQAWQAWSPYHATVRAWADLA